MPVICEGSEFASFAGFGTGTVHFGIQEAAAGNGPSSVPTWRIGVTDIGAAVGRCRSAGMGFELERSSPGPGRACRRLLICTPGGCRLALEDPGE